MADQNSDIDRLVNYLLHVFNSAIEDAQVQNALYHRARAVEAELRASSSKSDKPDKNTTALSKVVSTPSPIATPLALGILTVSGHLAGGSVSNPISSKNHNGENVIGVAFQNLEALKIIQPKADFRMAAVAVTVEASPDNGTPLDFDWSLYPDHHHQLFKDQGMKEILLVSPSNGQTRLMPLAQQLCA